MLRERRGREARLGRSIEEMNKRGEQGTVKMEESGEENGGHHTSRTS